MYLKEKIVGIILIAVGIFPLLIEFGIISKSISPQLLPFLTQPQLYHIIAIILGIILLYNGRYYRRRF